MNQISFIIIIIIINNVFFFQTALYYCLCTKYIKLSLNNILQLQVQWGQKVWGHEWKCVYIVLFF